MYMTTEMVNKLTKKCEKLEKEILELRSEIRNIRKTIFWGTCNELIEREKRLHVLEKRLRDVKMELEEFYNPKAITLTVVYDDELDIDKLLNGEIKGVLL